MRFFGPDRAGSPPRAAAAATDRGQIPGPELATSPAAELRILYQVIDPSRAFFVKPDPQRRRGEIAPAARRREGPDLVQDPEPQIRMLRIERSPIRREALAEAGQRPGAYTLAFVRWRLARTGRMRAFFFQRAGS